LYYVICLGLLSSNFLFNLIGRSLVYTICQGIVLVTRLQNGEADILASVFLHVCAMLLLETIFYVQQKAQAGMYLAKQNAGFQ